MAPRELRHEPVGGSASPTRQRPDPSLRVGDRHRQGVIDAPITEALEGEIRPPTSGSPLTVTFWLKSTGPTRFAVRQSSQALRVPPWTG
jgi:hypothetical protein